MCARGAVISQNLIGRQQTIICDQTGPIWRYNNILIRAHPLIKVDEQDSR